MSNLPFPQWGAQQPNASFANPSKFQKRSTMFERKIRRRNMFEYIAGLIGSIMFAWFAWTAFTEGESLMAASWLLQIVGTIVVLLNLRKVGSNLPHSPEQDCRSHLRAQLAHQHKALSSVGRWYLGPFIPGLLAVFLAMVEITSRQTGWAIAFGMLALPAVVVVAMFVGIFWLNKRAAKQLAQQISELDGLVDPA